MIFSKGYGFRDLTQSLPFTPNTIFPIASNTKLFTAIAAGMLVERTVLQTFAEDVRSRIHVRAIA